MAYKEPSQRQLRVGEEIRHILASALMRAESGSPLLDRTPVTVTEVRISPDLRVATVYIMPLGGVQDSEMLTAFKNKAGYFRNAVAKNLQTRVAPRLVFHFDDSFDEARRIEALLASPKVKRDVEQVLQTERDAQDLQTD